MRYPSVLLAGFLMACTVPPNTPVVEAVPKLVENPKSVVPKLIKAPKTKVAPTAEEETSDDKTACAGIQTGNVKEDIHLKLDCLLSPTDGK